MEKDTIIIDESMANKVVNAFKTGDMSQIKDFADHYVINSLRELLEAIDTKQFNRLQLFSFTTNMPAEDMAKIKEILGSSR